MAVSWPEVVCPTDHRPLDAQSGALRCGSGHLWRVDRGIPRMVPNASSYAETFGIQWKTYRQTQLDSYTHTTISRDRLLRCLRENRWKHLQEGGRIDVLETGCGAGRFTEVLLTTGARITALDFTTAIDANRDNFGMSERLRHVQGDILNLPFNPRQFDLVLSLGVIQHTPDPEATIAALYEQVKPGGSLIFDHYRYNLSYYTKTAPLVRAVLRRLSPEQGLKWTERLVRVFFPLHRAVGRGRIPHALLSRVSPVVSYHHYSHVLPLNDTQQWEWALLDTHDSLTDWYKHFRTRGQIQRALERLGASEIDCTLGGNGIEARCRRPADRND
jgi:2-polyprenyl-3-methyl-5-hydroxy-6-metoxy-1,4-benzoquinol methylase